MPFPSAIARRKLRELVAGRGDPINNGGNINLSADRTSSVRLSPGKITGVSV